MSDDELLFIDDDVGDEEPNLNEPWKIAIIDDEEQVHDVTKLVLGGFNHAGRPLVFISAFSAEEGRALFKEHDDIAVCLLDVVMETQTAGLDLVKLIRKDNDFTRIVLRTGQPGNAPEEEVITSYDINDYKEKTELTRPKMRTMLHACLKTYEHLLSQEQTRMGLECVIDATSKIYSKHFIEEFAEGILLQLGSLFDFGPSAAFATIDQSVAAYKSGKKIKIISGIGDYEGEENLSSMLAGLLDALDHGQKQFAVVSTDDYFLASYLGSNEEHYLLALKGEVKEFSALQYKLISIFCNNVLVAFENIYLQTEIEESQSEMVYMLGEAVETRSKETGHHLKRVSNISGLLAHKLGLDKRVTDLIVLASPLHDIGKIAIPDAILNKPGKLEGDEWEIMKSHAEIGYRMLLRSSKAVMKVAANLAHDHHEWWDGNGYPGGKKGEAISIEGRISAVADVFDALSSRRCYKEAWSYDKAFNYISNGSGTQFDPAVADALLALRDEVTEICVKYHGVYD